jgi:hypothetical protein
MGDATMQGVRQLAYDCATAYHRARQHNQFFTRCEDDLCIRARAELGIKGDGHEFDTAYWLTVEEVEGEQEAARKRP